MTQYKARSLDRHIRQGWSFLSNELGEYVEVLPSQQRANEEWYRGTADALYHNIYSLESEKKELTLILAGDHIYKMDYGQMIAAHIGNQADLTVGAAPVPYWRDVGTIDAYYQANMDLVDVVPVLNLYDKSWPIRTLQPQLPPPKFVHFAPGPAGEARRGEAVDSMVCAGSIVSGGHVRHSILSPNVRVNSFAIVQDSILFEGVKIGRKARVKR